MFNSKYSDEVARLRDEVDRLYEAKQSAWQEKERQKKIVDDAKHDMDQAWERRDNAKTEQNHLYDRNQNHWSEICRLRDDMNSAFEQAKSIRTDNQRMWDDVHQTLDNNNRRIDELKARANSMADDMRTAFSNASDAWGNHDGESAKSYSEEGHRLQSELQKLNAEVKSLIDKNKSTFASAKSSGFDNSAWNEFNRLRDQYSRAKEDHATYNNEFKAAKARFQQAKAEHERARDKFQNAKEDFNRARDKFNDLNQQFKAAKVRFTEAKKHHQLSARDIARQAGVPSEYLDNVVAKEDSPGCYSIYFGGAGTSDGPGHGHYALDNDSVTYRRDPFDPHGAENYADYQACAQRDDARTQSRASIRGAATQAEILADKNDRYEIHRGDGTTIFGSKSRDRRFSKKNYNGKTSPKDLYQHGHKGKDFYRSEHDAVAEFAIDAVNDPDHARPHNASFHYKHMTKRWKGDDCEDE